MVVNVSAAITSQRHHFFFFSVHPLPGNHESDHLNMMYGFEGEVKSKYSSIMMNLFSELFNWLPLAHCIEGKILVREGHG